jgi:hypothetical protein
VLGFRAQGRGIPWRGWARIRAWVFGVRFWGLGLRVWGVTSMKGVSHATAFFITRADLITLDQGAGFKFCSLMCGV